MVAHDDPLYPLEERIAISDRAKRDDEALEVVMIVLALAFQFMMRRAVGDICFGLCFEADQDVGSERALARRDDPRAGRAVSAAGLL